LTQTKQEEKQRDKTIDDVLKSLNIENLPFKDRMLIKHVIAPKCQLLLSLREKTKNILVMYTDVVRECSRMLAAEMVRQQRIPDQDLLYYIGFDELKPLVMDHQPVIVMQATRRRQLFKRVFSELWKFDEIFTEVIPLHMKPTKELDEAIAQAPKLMGTPASSGRVQGKICRVEGYKDLDKVRPGTILLTHSTDIAFSPVFPMISGIITEVGGLISHGAVVAREYGLPSLIGIPDVMRILEDGEEIILDADNGTIVRLSKGENSCHDGTIEYDKP
jgi:pyruvate,water dikinase